MAKRPQQSADCSLIGLEFPQPKPDSAPVGG